jgi:hypothetical protein
MRLTRKAVGRMLGGASRQAGRKPPGKAERAQANADRAQKKAAEAEALRAEVEAKVAKEQDAVLAQALHEDEKQRQADIAALAEKEAEAIPEWPPNSSGGRGEQPRSPRS